MYNAYIAGIVNVLVPDSKSDKEGGTQQWCWEGTMYVMKNELKWFACLGDEPGTPLGEGGHAPVLSRGHVVRDAGRRRDEDKTWYGNDSHSIEVLLDLR